MRTLACLLLATAIVHGGEFVSLFPKDGLPEGWKVQRWDDVKEEAPPGALWRVKDGVLHGSDMRGTWLVSEKEYGDFVLEFEWKLGEQGNSGCGLRFPTEGDPAFEGIELQMADARYNPQAKESELTGGLYRAVAPRKQVYKPTEWNHYKVTMKGPQVTVVLNGETVLDLNLDEQKETVKRHDGKDAKPLAERPRRGRIGFQELSRGGSFVQIRNARVMEL
jgi:hypothetical protein